MESLAQQFRRQLPTVNAGDPQYVPQLVAATNGSAAAASGDAAGALAWAGLLVAFALVYWVLGFTIVPAALE